MGAITKANLLAAACLMLSAAGIRAEEVSPPPGKEALADWPAGWVSTYQRFEDFLATKKQVWPSAGLQLIDGAEFIHCIPDGSLEGKRVSLNIYEAGAETLCTATRRGKGTDLSHYGPGVFCVFAQTTGELGFQSHFPIVWWESVKKEKPMDGGPLGSFEHTLRIIPAPGEGMAVWPNERLLGFLDFHIFSGHRYRDDIYQENEVVSPAAHLGCDEHGVIERHLFPDPKVEALLVWRIYHDGKLVDPAKAAGVTRLEMKNGFGTYLVMLGVEGPGGFLPVSNFSSFPLFPDGDGAPVVVPRDSDSDGTPDFIEKMVKSGTAGPLDVPADQDTDGDGLTDIEEVGPQVIAPAGPAATESRQSLRLWAQWNYELGTWRPQPK